MSTAAERVSGTISERVSGAVAALQQGRPVLVADARDRENEYDVVLPAALAEPRWTAWTVRHTSGLLCAPLPAEIADALELPLMVERNEDPRGTAYTVSVDASTGVSTGISAADRARTARVLADPTSRPSDLVRPGHVLPLRARPGGVLERPGHTEVAVDLCRLAGLPPVALIAELVAGERMANTADARILAEVADLPILDIADVVAHRLRFGDGVRARVTRGATTRLPTTHGLLDAVGFRDEVTGAEHMALLGPPGTLAEVHGECLLGDVFGATTCTCATDLTASAERVARDGGVLVYLRRSGSLATAITHNTGHHPWTPADDAAVAAILDDLGHTTVRRLPTRTKIRLLEVS
jgi:3,4-dihydroxy 2-butanone 4-phosphate synthase / GTP cyclohydrolase II